MYLKIVVKQLEMRPIYITTNTVLNIAHNFQLMHLVLQAITIPFNGNKVTYP